MKNLLIFLLLSAILISCGSEPQEANSRDRAAFSASTAAPTPSRVPTPTIDFQQTAVVAQSTADAARELMVQVTAEQDRRKHEELSWTHTADQATIAAGQLTQQSDIATATAALTYVPLTQTHAPIAATNTQAVENDMRTQRAMTVNAPTLIVAISDAHTKAKYAERNEKVTIGVRIAIGFFIFVLALFVLVSMLTGARNSLVSNLHKERDEGIPPLGDIPFSPVEQEKGIDLRLRAEIPCPNEILVELAEGVINRRMTLSYNMWEGTPVHRYLKGVREYFTEHRLVKHVRGQGGMLDILATGEAFLLHVVEHGEPPAPHRCINSHA